MWKFLADLIGAIVIAITYLRTILIDSIEYLE